MVVEQKTGQNRFPLEDVAWVVLETAQATVTSALLSACAENGIVVVACDGRHMPCGVLISFHEHHRQTAMLRRQMAVTPRLSGLLWQRLVRRKIANQAAVLKFAAKSEAADTLMAMRSLVLHADIENVEARAARAYWPLLFDSFRRHDEDRRNALLNYGYAILRAMIARALVAHGYVPALGIHHNRATNAFNLADDLIEPYRPLVDRTALSRLADVPDGKVMTRDDRQAMLGICRVGINIEKTWTGLLDAATTSVASLTRAIEANNAVELLLPDLSAKESPNAG